MCESIITLKNGNNENNENGNYNNNENLIETQMKMEK